MMHDNESHVRSAGLDSNGKSVISSGGGQRRYKQFKKQDWDNEPGNNLVINRKSLNRESMRKTQEEIRHTNLKFLNRLQNLESDYKCEKLVAEHGRRGEIVERISRYPMAINHQGVKSD